MGMIVSWMLVASAVAAFSITALSGCVVIPALHRLHFGQTIRESGPTWHNKKQGTPTMGGLCFILGIVLALVLVLVGFRRYAPELMGTQQIQAVLLVMFLAPVSYTHLMHLPAGVSGLCVRRQSQSKTDHPSSDRSRTG